MPVAKLHVWNDVEGWYIAVSCGWIDKFGHLPVCSNASSVHAKRKAELLVGDPPVHWRPHELEGHEGNADIVRCDVLQQLKLTGAPEGPPVEEVYRAHDVRQAQRVSVPKYSRVCCVDGCTKYVHVRDLCGMHYSRWKSCAFPPLPQWLAVGAPNKTAWRNLPSATPRRLRRRTKVARGRLCTQQRFHSRGT